MGKTGTMPLRGQPTNWSSLLPAERHADASRRGWERRRCIAWMKLTPLERRKEAAKKGAETRKQNKLAQLTEHERRSLAARKGWRTRLSHMDLGPRRALLKRRRDRLQSQTTDDYHRRSQASRKGWTKRRRKSMSVTDRLFDEMRQEVIDSKLDALQLSVDNPTQAVINQIAQKISKQIEGELVSMPEKDRANILCDLVGGELELLLDDIDYTPLAFVDRLIVGAYIKRADGGEQWVMLSHALGGKVALEQAVRKIKDWTKKYGQVTFTQLSIREYTSKAALTD